MTNSYDYKPLSYDPKQYNTGHTLGSINSLPNNKLKNPINMKDKQVMITALFIKEADSQFGKNSFPW